MQKNVPVPKPGLDITPASAALLRATIVLLETRLQEHATLATQINAQAEELQQGMAALQVRIAELKALLDEAKP